ncbi:hypothetical protein EW026_g1154 [Hermanssonia centrifuga]|uniref:PH domain-containing protein n=1 Tax=Hermanssonia centrifuga TaxID=98765 RepID=A0A4S4KWY5_9APHY|nr:hypothetical protein EW026_g1154 [Hermanssonia centrifuga]
MQAHPPPPPGPSIGVNDSQALNTSETIRGARQVLEATGMTDLRNVVAVRRAFQVIPSQSEEVAAHDVPEWEDGESFWENVDTYDDDYRDGGGEEGLANVQDKQQRQVRRSFELLLKSGRIMRFEVYSCQYALEWIARLRPLISYWKKRHQVDAREEMDLVHASTGRPRITARRHVHDEQDAAPETPPDPDKSSPDLSSFYNWCLLDGCRAISKCGKLFSRKGLRGQYKHVQLVLVPGHLVQFRITGTSLYHRRGKYLPEGQYDPDSPPLPRRYQDGLESNDQDEDTLFMIWSYKKERDAYVSSKNIPPLSAKRQIFVFRTRSKLERDAWVWAIKAEVEKAARDVPAREKLLREDGELLT